MDVEIVPIGTLDPSTDVASKWGWINSNGDGGSVVVFDDRVVHVCAKATGDDNCTVSEIQNCPNSCGVRFYPDVWKQTRVLHGI